MGKDFDGHPYEYLMTFPVLFWIAKIVNAEIRLAVQVKIIKESQASW